MSGREEGFSSKKILIALAAIPVLFYGIWIVFPNASIQSIIEDSINSDKLGLEVKGLKKGLFYNLAVDRLTLKSSGEELVSLNNIYGHISPLSFIMLWLNISFDGGIGGGNFSGRANLTKNKMQIELDINKANINGIPLFKLIGIQGTGTVSGRFNMLDDTGHVEFVTEDSRLEPAILSGVNVPLNFFNSIRGTVDIKGNMINVVSIALEGKDIHARLKGAVKDAVMNLNLELMPGISFIENPLFRGELERYKISPGYYVIPLKGSL
ncbi:MAG: type II secretion system protein GspN [Nitrospirota bacterium]